MKGKVLLSGALLITGGLGTWFAQGPGAAGTDAVVAVRAGLDVERALLQEDTRRYEQLSAARDRAVTTLNELYQSLDAAVKRGEGQNADEVQRIMDEIELAEKLRTGMLTAERVLVDGISERLRKIGMLEDQLEALRNQARQAAGAMSGSWDVTLLPINQRGRFAIVQTGTLLSGTYSLDGGYTGSLQGTLVNRKVYLVRIDSKLGRSMEFEGYLASDDKRIRGTWLNYELAGQEGATGQWSAVRRQSRP